MYTIIAILTIALTLIAMSVCIRKNKKYLVTCLISICAITAGMYFTNPYFQKVAIGFNQNSVKDTYIIHGFVQIKKIINYDCKTSKRCVVDKDGNPKYESERDWLVKTDIGNFTINRLDEQGIAEPFLFRKTNVNDAAFSYATFNNYKLLSSQYTGKGSNELSKYPSIYSDFMLEPVIDMTHSDLGNYWNYNVKSFLSFASQKYLGVEFNPIVVITTEPSKKFTHELLNKWRGIKYNDVLLVVSINGLHVNGVSVTTYNPTENRTLTSEIQHHYKKNPNDLDIIGYLNVVSQNYNMPSARYMVSLQDSLKPSVFQNVLYNIAWLIFGYGVLILIDLVFKRFKW